MDEGYGLSREAGAEHCLQKHPAPLLLAVDCGSTAVDTIAWLGEQGTEVDRARPSPGFRAAAGGGGAGQSAAGAISPDRSICSAGLAFKLAHALVKQLREPRGSGGCQV